MMADEFNRLPKSEVMAHKSIDAGTDITRLAMQKRQPLSLPTKALRTALRALYQCGGNGSVQRRGVLVEGHWLPFDGRSWMRLAASGFVEISAGRIVLTEDGKHVAEKEPVYDFRDENKDGA